MEQDARRIPTSSQNKELRDLIDQIIQRMEEEGYITQQQSARVTPPPSETPGGQTGQDQGRTWKRDLRSPTKPSIFSASKR